MRTPGCFAFLTNSSGKIAHSLPSILGLVKEPDSFLLVPRCCSAILAEDKFNLTLLHPVRMATSNIATIIHGVPINCTFPFLGALTAYQPLHPRKCLGPYSLACRQTPSPPRPAQSSQHPEPQGPLPRSLAAPHRACHVRRLYTKSDGHIHRIRYLVCLRLYTYDPLERR